ncbi:hypothetical protein [Specibacter sp. RAF43]|uniref:hypothetical protein n=1 Tax=Specibacter sp. RAF43 TaxID=3233057 RepID=UPI003F9C0EBC
MAGSRIRNALSFRSPLTRLSGVAAVSAVVALAGCSGAPATPGGTGPAGSGTGASQGSPSAPPSSGSAGATSSAESTVKALVAGFPVKLIPLMGGAVIGQSTLERGTPISKAGVTFDVSAKTADVMAYYAKVFTGQSFTALPGTEVAGVPTKTFVRANGRESVVVSAVQSGPTSTVTVGATVLAASLK